MSEAATSAAPVPGAASALALLVRPSSGASAARGDRMPEATRVALARAADEQLGLEVAIEAAVPGRGDAREATDAITAGDLIFLLSGDGRPPGLMTLSPSLLQALIEVQVNGRVSPAPLRERSPTRTDGVVVRPLAEAWLAELADPASGLAGLAGYRLGSMLADPRAAHLAIEPAPFVSLVLTLALGGGARNGVLALHWPAPDDTAGAASARFDPGRVDVDLDVVLTRLRRPLREVAALAPGDVIEIAPAALAAVAVERDGRRVATARLGRMNGRRAIRREMPPPPDAPPFEAPKLAASGATPGADPPSPEGLAVAEAAETRPLDVAAARDATGADLPDPAAAMPALPDLPDLPELPDAAELPEFDDLPPLE